MNGNNYDEIKIVPFEEETWPPLMLGIRIGVLILGATKISTMNLLMSFQATLILFACMFYESSNWTHLGFILM